MIKAGRGLYDYCGGCGKLVQLNKFIFGSMHLCSGRSASEGDMHGFRAAMRKKLKTVLRNCSITSGVNNDAFCDDDECGISVGKWTLCITEDENLNDVVCWFSNTDDLVIGKPTDSVRQLTRGLRAAIAISREDNVSGTRYNGGTEN